MFFRRNLQDRVAEADQRLSGRGTGCGRPGSGRSGHRAQPDQHEQRRRQQEPVLQEPLTPSLLFHESLTTRRVPFISKQYFFISILKFFDYTFLLVQK